jgi:hypothetical protein
MLRDLRNLLTNKLIRMQKTDGSAGYWRRLVQEVGYDMDSPFKKDNN